MNDSSNNIRMVKSMVRKARHVAFIQNFWLKNLKGRDKFGSWVAVYRRILLQYTWRNGVCRYGLYSRLNGGLL